MTKTSNVKSVSKINKNNMLHTLATRSKFPLQDVIMLSLPVLYHLHCHDQAWVLLQTIYYYYLLLFLLLLY